MDKFVRRTFPVSHPNIVLALAISALVNACSVVVPAPVGERSPTPTAQSRAPVAQGVSTQTATPTTSSQTAESAPVPQGYYRVKRGDTLYSIALDNGQDHRDVARWNALDNPNRIQAGQQLRVVPPEAEAGVQIAPVQGSGSVTARPLDEPIKPEPAKPEAIKPEAQRVVTETAKPAAAGVQTEPRAQRLAYSDQTLANMQRAAEAKAQTAAPTPKPEPVRPVDAVKPAPEVAKPAAEPMKPAAEARDTETPEFIWPARGKLLSGFNESTNKGLDISGKAGDPIVAAAPGRVIYVGTGIRGYGKLIVIKHEGNFNSVYAHNREILVKQDQQVARGQKIAELGDTDADQPKLHFEIRRTGKPVDPAKFLPAP